MNRSPFDLRLLLLAQRKRIAETLHPAVRRPDVDETAFRAWMTRGTR